jgi:DNA-directed RNA polymerase specialized sigma24 family protein
MRVIVSPKLDTDVLSMKRDMNYLAAAAKARSARDEASGKLETAVRAAHVNGWSIREIAGRIGLSSSRVHQLLSKGSTHEPT